MDPRVKHEDDRRGGMTGRLLCSEKLTNHASPAYEPGSLHSSGEVPDQVRDDDGG
ncbi:MAG: hypothetical protein L3J21_03475 [Devosiaceae bacterium]|nr:hypothetical protein [Devosiaceae bacterium]